MGNQKYACWWHTKNQCWNTDTSSNFYALAQAFGMSTSNGGSKWCHSRSSALSCQACGGSNSGYFSSSQTGAWGWCGGSSFSSGGSVCFEVGTGYSGCSKG